MDPNLITPQQAIASLANIAPFLWPFVLLSLGVALTPVSPISWSYSTWLLFIIPLIITVFAPIRTFSGPLRYAYLEYASKIGSLAVSLLKAVVTNFQSIPTLALPALFFLPVLPVLFFVFFPALPVAWHFIAYHYRRRLKVITTSVAKTNASLDLAITHARQAMALAHTYEKQALCTVSTTRSTPSLALTRHSTDFGTPVFNDSEGRWRLIPSPGTVGADLAGKVLDTEKQMAVIEEVSQRVLAFSEQAVAVATEGDMVMGDELAGNAAHSLENVVQQVDELRSKADEARCTWIEFRRRLNKVTTSVSTTTASLDVAIAHARQAITLVHTYEKQALCTVSTTRSTPSLALTRHSTDFGTPVFNEGRWQLIPSPGTLGAELAGRVLDTEKQMAIIEEVSQRVLALSEQAVAVATEGDMVRGDELAEYAAHSLEDVVQKVEELRSKADQARCTWIEFRRRLNMVTTSVSTTTASLDVAIAHARQAMALAHTYEKQALCTVSTTRSTPLLALTRHSTDSSTPVFNDSEGHWQLIPSPGTLGAELAGKVLDTEKQMAVIEELSKNVLALSELAVSVATEGDMVRGDRSVENAAHSLEDVVQQVDELRSKADEARCKWIEFRRRLNKVTTSVSRTTASLEVALVRGRRAAVLAHTYEERALDITSTTCRTASRTLMLHSTNFFDTAVNAWAAVGHTTGHAEGVVPAAAGVVQAADNVRKSRSSDGNRPTRLEDILFKQATDAHAAALNTQQLARQARESVVWSEKAKTEAGRAREQVHNGAIKIRTMGVNLASALENVEARVASIEDEAKKVRAALEKAVVVGVEGDMDAAEQLVTDAENSFDSAVQPRVDELCSIADKARSAWVEISLEMSSGPLDEDEALELDVEDDEDDDDDDDLFGEPV